MTVAEAHRPATRDELAVSRAFVEQIVGRELRPAEQAIDVVKLDRALNDAKDEVERAIKTEQRKAVRRAIALTRPVRLRVTREMLRPLERLYQLGREEAAAELGRLGHRPTVPPLRHYEDAAFRWPRLGQLLEGIIHDGLTRISIRIDHELVHADLTDASTDAIARALMKVPGGRDLASRVISTALYSGMGAVFEENEGVVAGWEYTAILDGNQCERCQPFDGRRYATWAEATIDLPNGGPNPLCLGGGRCRCRLVPLGS